MGPTQGAWWSVNKLNGLLTANEVFIRKRSWRDIIQNQLGKGICDTTMDINIFYILDVQYVIWLKWRGMDEGMCFFNLILCVDWWIFARLLKSTRFEARSPFISLIVHNRCGRLGELMEELIWLIWYIGLKIGKGRTVITCLQSQTLPCSFLRLQWWRWKTLKMLWTCLCARN